MKRDKNIDAIQTQKKVNAILNLTSDIDAICVPLYSLGITYFSYTKINSDGSRVDLNNNPNMAEYYYLKSNAYEDSSIEGDPFAHETGFILWSTLPNDEPIQVSREYFNTDHGITLVNKEKDYCELWHFASTRNNSRIINFYLNNLDVLKFFTLYFRDKYKEITKHLDERKIQIVSSEPVNVIEQSLQQPSINKQAFVQSLKTGRYYLGGEYADTYLTHRELECLLWCVAGKTATETAIIIGGSERTIEVHLNSVKQKLNCYKQAQLVHKAIKLGLTQF